MTTAHSFDDWDGWDVPDTEDAPDVVDDLLVARMSTLFTITTSQKNSQKKSPFSRHG